MSLYLDSDTLARAVWRLSVSSAKPVLCDFLILRHAMTHGDGTATLSPKDATYMDAVNTVAGVQDADLAELPPFFNPFGTGREKIRGWRSKKYPSNGPPVTVAGSNWQRVIDVLAKGPRRVRFTDNYVDNLPRVVLTSGGEPPLIEDCAAWFYRAADVDPYVDVDSTTAELTELFLSEVGLTRAEQNAIFQGE